MNYDKADLSDPLIKLNIKNFGTPKSGTQPTEHPGVKKRRYDKIIPVMTAKKMKTFKQFKEETEEKFKNTMKTKAKELVSPLEKFAKSDDAKKLMQQGMGLLFNKFDGVVKKGNEKYNEIKSKVNK